MTMQPTFASGSLLGSFYKGAALYSGSEQGPNLPIWVLRKVGFSGVEVKSEPSLGLRGYGLKASALKVEVV